MTSVHENRRRQERMKKTTINRSKIKVDKGDEGPKRENEELEEMKKEEDDN